MNVTYSCKVSFGGQTPVTLQMMNNQFDNVTISGGSDGYDQPQATTANLQFLNPVFGGVQLTPAQLVGQPIQIATTYEFNGSTTTNNFYGVVQNVSMEPVDSTATNNVLSINAVSLMGLYSRKQIRLSGTDRVHTSRFSIK